MSTNNEILDRLLTEFEKLNDSRRAQGKRHPLSFALLIVLLATMSGYFGYRAIEDFLEKHNDCLIDLFAPEKDRIPSYSTVRRILMAIDFDDFTQIYKEWLSRYWSEQHESTVSKWCGVDGKALRGTVENTDPNAYTHLVSIFSSFDQIVLDAGKVQDKSNEIPLVQELIKNSDLKNVVFTLDALHCQKKTVEAIIETGNDYVIGVKENQPTLYRQIEAAILENDPVDQDYTLEQNRGRREERAVFVYENLELIDPDWKGLRSIVQVERKTEFTEASNKKMRKETAYYIASITKDARELNQGIRGHWRIENTLHWTKDVVLNEDRTKIKAGNAPENISLIKNWVMTIFRKNKFTSMTKAIRIVANDIRYMVKLLE